MSEKKVLFHALERLDLIDVEALQEQVLTYLAQALGNVVGREQGTNQRIGAILNKPVTTTIVNGVNSAYTIGFSDFSFLEANSDSPVSISRKSSIVTFDASESFHGTCDFSSARTLVQNYYNTQSALPPVGGAVGYTESGTGLFYPFIWVKSDQVTALTDNRRFWSVANGQETTSTVATRSDKAVQFKVQYASPSGEYIKIARIVEWSLNGSTVELQSSGIVFLSLADTLVPLPTFGGTSDEAPAYYAQYNSINDAYNFSGLLSCFKAIQNELQLIRSGGADDATYGTTLTNMTRVPRLSLDGLYDRSTDLQSQIRQTRQIGSAIFVFEANEDAGTFDFEVINNTTVSTALPRITLDGHANYARLLNKNNPPPTPLNFSGSDWNPTGSIGISNWVAGASLFSVEVPASLAGREIRVNPVVIATHNVGTPSVLTAESTTGIYNEAFANLGAFIVTDDPRNDTYTEALRVQQVERVDASGNTVLFYGVNIGVAGVDQVFTSSRINNDIVRIVVKVDIELVEI